MLPVLLEWRGHALHTYGLLAALSWAAALALALVRGSRRGWDPWLVLELLIGLVVAGILGARILYLVQHPEHWHGWRSLVDLRAGGLVYLGGFLLAALYVVLRSRQVGRQPLEVLDLLIPSVALALGIARLGCLAAGCCYGRPTTLPWGVVFRDPRAVAPLHQALHPTQLYLSLVNLSLLTSLLWLEGRRRYRGQLFVTYLWGYALARFAVELLRGDEARRYLLRLDLWGDPTPELLSTSQGLGLLLLVLALALGAWGRRHARLERAG